MQSKKNIRGNHLKHVDARDREDGLQLRIGLDDAAYNFWLTL